MGTERGGEEILWIDPCLRESELKAPGVLVGIYKGLLSKVIVGRSEGVAERGEGK